MFADDARRCDSKRACSALAFSALAFRVRRPIGILAIPLTFALVFSGVHSPVSKRSDRFLSYGVSQASVSKVRHAAHRRKPRTVISEYDLCVANRENGEPGALTYNTINWHAVNEYYGAYSFLHGTWVAAGGLRYTSNANEASPVDQSIIFNSYSARDPGAWPNTIPPCLHLR